MNPILVLSSYGVGDQVGAHYPPVRAFVRELADHGIPPESVVAHHARSLRAQADYLRGLPFVPSLIYACGSSVMEVVLRFLAERGAGSVPVVYWGSHILDGEELVNDRPSSPTVFGIDLPMPLYHSHRQFRLLRQLFPNLQQVSCVFSMESAFVQGQRRARYLRAREQGRDWIPSGSELSAFPSMARLGELIDVEIREHPCATPEAIVRAVRALPGSPDRSREAVRACLVSCIDAFHVEGAVEAMARAAHEAGVPFIGLNFGSFMPEHGPLLSCESDLDGAARIAASMARELLRSGRPPAGDRFRGYDRFLFRCNPALMKAWGMRLSERDLSRIRSSFDDVVHTLPEVA